MLAFSTSKGSWPSFDGVDIVGKRNQRRSLAANANAGSLSPPEIRP